MALVFIFKQQVKSNIWLEATADFWEPVPFPDLKSWEKCMGGTILSHNPLNSYGNARQLDLSSVNVSEAG